MGLESGREAGCEWGNMDALQTGGRAEGAWEPGLSASTRWSEWSGRQTFSERLLGPVRRNQEELRTFLEGPETHFWKEDGESYLEGGDDLRNDLDGSRREPCQQSGREEQPRRENLKRQRASLGWH